MATLLTAVEKYSANHNRQYPASFDLLTASGDLGDTNFAGNLGLDDFEFTKDGTADPQGKEVILSLRVPLRRPGRPSVIVLGGIGDNGATHTIIMNVSSDPAQASPAPPQ